MKVVKFKEEGHEYKCGKYRYTSVSGFTKNFYHGFDKENKSLEMCYKGILGKGVIAQLNEKYRDWPHKVVSHIEDRIANDTQIEQAHRCAELLKEEWSEKGDKSSQFGTDYHTAREEEDMERGWRENPWTGKKFEIPDVVYKMKEGHDNISLAENLYDLPDGYYPEMLVHDHENKIAGQADMMFIETINGERFVDIDDWKTDEKIKEEAWFYKNRGYQMMKYPLDHLHECNWNLYEVKISIYGYLMENFGYRVRNLGFTHILFDSHKIEAVDEKRYDLLYRKHEADAMFREYTA